MLTERTGIWCRDRAGTKLRTNQAPSPIKDEVLVRLVADGPHTVLGTEVEGGAARERRRHVAARVGRAAQDERPDPRPRARQGGPQLTQRRQDDGLETKQLCEQAPKVSALGSSTAGGDRAIAE